VRRVGGWVCVLVSGEVRGCVQGGRMGVCTGEWLGKRVCAGCEDGCQKSKVYNKNLKTRTVPFYGRPAHAGQKRPHKIRCDSPFKGTVQ